MGTCTEKLRHLNLGIKNIIFQTVSNERGHIMSTIQNSEISKLGARGYSFINPGNNAEKLKADKFRKNIF